MVYTDKEKYADILERAIKYLESNGFENIMAAIDGFKSPKSYRKSGNGISLTPDIVADKEGKKHLFDISLKSEKPKLLRSKWLFLSALSNMKSYRFKIITAGGHYKFTQDMLNAVNLSNKKPLKI